MTNVSFQAREVDSGVPLSDEKSSVTAEVSVRIRDVNDEPPKFNRKEYRVRIPENLPKGSPLPYLDMVVTDTDVVSVFAQLLSDFPGCSSLICCRFFRAIIRRIC